MFTNKYQKPKIFIRFFILLSLLTGIGCKGKEDAGELTPETTTTTTQPEDSDTTTTSTTTSTSAGTSTATSTSTNTTGNSACTDGDGDGFCIEDDCNDDDAGIYPGATENAYADFIDQNCDGSDANADSASAAATSTTTLLTSSPCDSVGGIAYASLAQDANNIWIGCAGAGGGLFKSTNGGSSFSQVTEANSGVTSIEGSSTRVYDLEFDDSGNVLICGGNANVTDTVFLYRYSPTTHTYSTLLKKSTVRALGGTNIGNCENVVASGNTILIDDLSGSQIVYSTNGGTSWSKKTVGQVSSFIKTATDIYASGGTTGDGPDFYQTTLTSPSALTASDVDIDITNLQEARDIASPDGLTFLISGAYDMRDSGGVSYNDGVWIRYTDDNGATWTEATIDDPTQYSFVRALHCVEDTCFVAGDFYPASQGGYILQSDDAGLTWNQVELDDTIGTIYSITSTGDDVFFTGDGADLVKITIE